MLRARIGAARPLHSVGDDGRPPSPRAASHMPTSPPTPRTRYLPPTRDPFAAVRSVVTRLHRTAGRPAAALALGTALALGPAACGVTEPSDAVRQDRIYTEYELRYDGTRDVTVARAGFRFGGAGGTQLELTGASRVTFRGEPLTRVQVTSGLTYYERTLPGLVAEGAFRFEDTDGRAYANAVALRAIAYAGTPAPIDNDESYTLPFGGDVLAAGEQARVTLFRLAPGAVNLGVFVQGDVGARTVVLDRGQLQNVAAGQVTLVLERRRVGPPAQAPAAGGQVTTSYAPANVTATVVD